MGRVLSMFRTPPQPASADLTLPDEKDPDNNEAMMGLRPGHPARPDAVVPAGMGAAVKPDQEEVSFIAPGMRIEGATLNNPDAKIIIAGELVGVSLTCREATILSTGVVSGDINCQGKLHIHGKINGNGSMVRADELLIYKSANVQGDISARKVGSQLGAVLDAVIRTTTSNAPFLISGENAA